jgi:copper chaperone CopZ
MRRYNRGMFRIKPARLLREPGAEVVRDTGSTATLRVDGLVCSICAGNVQQHLERVPGVSRAYVDLEAGVASVSYQHPLRNADALAPAVRRAVWFPRVRRIIDRLAHPA